jgi:hypothetical protein
MTDSLLLGSITRFLAEAQGDGTEGQGEDEHFGVHISYQDIYSGIIFLACIYIAGIVAMRFFSMPALVGEIFCGIFLGPNLANLVPNPEAFVMLGEIG